MGTRKVKEGNEEREVRGKEKVRSEDSEETFILVYIYLVSLKNY